MAETNRHREWLACVCVRAYSSIDIMILSILSSYSPSCTKHRFPPSCLRQPYRTYNANECVCFFFAVDSCENHCDCFRFTSHTTKLIKLNITLCQINRKLLNRSFWPQLHRSESIRLLRQSVWHHRPAFMRSI